MSVPKWMPVAQSYQGTKEIPGAKHNPVILSFFDSVGAGWVKNDETAWCAAFVGACLEEVGVKSTGSLAARSYMDWGKSTTSPRYGDVCVFWRGNKNGWQGHVAFYVKDDDKYVYVLGGNQRNSVNVSRYPKSRLLGYRRAPSLGNSRTIAGSVASAVGTGGASVIDQVNSAQATLAGVPLEYAKYAMVALAFAGIALVVYARWDDWKRKGR